MLLKLLIGLAIKFMRRKVLCRKLRASILPHIKVSLVKKVKKTVANLDNQNIFKGTGNPFLTI
jgi:hypothetical protein